MKTRTALAVFTLLALFALIQAGMRGSETSRAYEAAEIAVNGHTLSVLLADTELKRIRGLSGRSDIGADGMLFLFPREDFHGIWMKEMMFPLDILWLADADRRGLKTQINADKEISVHQRDNPRESAVFRVVDIKENVAPETFPEVSYPREKAQYALEVNAGFAEANRVAIGDTFLLKR